MLSLAMSTPFPLHGWTMYRCPARGDDRAGQPVLHIAAQRCVDGQLGQLWTAGRAVRVPLRIDGPVIQTTAARGRIASQLTRDRGRRPPEATRDVPHAMTLGAQQRELLAFREEKVST